MYNRRVLQQLSLIHICLEPTQSGRVRLGSETVAYGCIGAGGAVGLNDLLGQMCIRDRAPTPEAKHLAEQAELQADRNRAYYAKNRELHRSVVLRLTEQIRNCILVHQQPNARVARSGNLNAGRIWRAPLLNDDRVFLCAEEENQPSFTVDLLLDASASRLHCQEVIAAQGSILAQSLAACGIPVRVSSFSSLPGYTCLLYTSVVSSEAPSQQP